MSKLTAIHKQISALQAKAERIAKQEMSAAVAKVKSLMSDFGVTIEHLNHSVGGKSTTKKSTAGKTAKAGKKTASVAKYADPKSGKTWSGFGRAPGWIADAKNRDSFLVGSVNSATKPAAAKKKAASKAGTSIAKSVKAKTATVTKRAATKTAPPKPPATKKSPAKPAAGQKAATKKVAKAKAVVKKVTRKASAKVAPPAPAEAPASAA
jgi:DNA-binding protein H-NS